MDEKYCALRNNVGNRGGNIVNGGGNTVNGGGGGVLWIEGEIL